MREKILTCILEKSMLEIVIIFLFRSIFNLLYLKIATESYCLENFM